MDRTDDTSSDVAVADGAATDSRRSGREHDTIYRRPPAQPMAAEQGGSWFNGIEMSASAPSSTTPSTAIGGRAWSTGEQRAVTEPPEYGPATPSGSGRVSFGFSAGPISPNRPATSSPAPSPAPEVPADEFEALRPRQRALPAGESSTGEFARPVTTDEFEALRPGAKADTGEFAAQRPSARPDEFAAPRSSVRPDEFASLRPGANASRPGTDEFAAVNPARPTTDDFAALRTAGDAVRSATDEFAAMRSEGLASKPATDEFAALRSTTERRREAPAESATPPRQSRFVTVGLVLLGVVVLLAGTIFGIAYFSGSDDKLDSVLQLGAGDTPKNVVTAPLDNRTKASFEMLAGVNNVHVKIGELGDDLYRISTPDDAGIVPSPQTKNDDVKLQVTRDGDGTGGEIEVVLAAKVHWALRFSGYAEQQEIDLSGGQVTGIEMVAGARKVDVTLAQPAGTVAVKVNGAVDQLTLKSPSSSPVRVRVDGGAKSVVAGSRTLKDVPAGSTLTPKNWATQNRYDVTAGARITSLSVENA